MKLHLVDGTYELFRAYFGAPPALSPAGAPVGAVRGFLRSLLSLLREDGVTHVGCAFDQVIESFRNTLFPGYKTGEGVPEDLLAQFPVAERGAFALGVVVWPMVEFEADDALSTAAARFSPDPGVEQILLCTPDKDLAQCVVGSRVVCFDRMRRRMLDDAGVREKFGVIPASIPDWLALVGDNADGIPGVPRWGERSASTVLSRFLHVDRIPADARDWGVNVRGAAALSESLESYRTEVALYRTLATLRTDAPVSETLDDLRWQGARQGELTAFCRETGDGELLERIQRWRPGS
jgi:5'-3' exonuclease